MQDSERAEAERERVAIDCGEVRGEHHHARQKLAGDGGRAQAEEVLDLR